MSRPKPQVILQDYQGNTCLEVCACEAVYGVYYRGSPIKIRKHNPQDPYGGFKYGKSSFPEPGHAIALAQRLNQQFSTEDFTVMEFRSGRVIAVEKTC